MMLCLIIITNQSLNAHNYIKYIFLILIKLVSIKTNVAVKLIMNEINFTGFKRKTEKKNIKKKIM